MLPICQPLPVTAKPRPFDGAEWLFELKYDGLRALAYIENGRCRLVSRKGLEFSSFGSLASSLAKVPNEGGVILDGKLLVWTPKAALVSTIFSCAVESPAFLLSICSVLTETIVGGTHFHNGSSHSGSC